MIECYLEGFSLFHMLKTVEHSNLKRCIFEIDTKRSIFLVLLQRPFFLVLLQSYTPFAYRPQQKTCRKFKFSIEIALSKVEKKMTLSQVKKIIFKKHITEKHNKKKSKKLNFFFNFGP